MFFCGGFPSHPLTRNIITQEWMRRDGSTFAMSGQVGEKLSTHQDIEKCRNDGFMLCPYGLFDVVATSLPILTFFQPPEVNRSSDQMKINFRRHVLINETFNGRPFVNGYSRIIGWTSTSPKND